MPIQINQLDVSPLAAVANSKTGALGLQAYGLDLGAPQRVAYERWLEQQKLAIAARGQDMQLKIQDMQNKGQLTIEAARDASQKEALKMKMQFDALQNSQDRALKQQEIQGNQSFQQGQLGLRGQEIMAQIAANNQQAQYNQGMLGMRGRELDNQSAFQRGTLANDQQRIDLDKYKVQMESLAAMKQEQANQMGAVASGAFMISQIKDPKQRDAEMGAFLDNNVKAGRIPEEMATKFKSMSPIQQQLMASQYMMAANMAGKLSNSNQTGQGAGLVGMQMKQGPDGQLSIGAPEAPSQLGTAIAKADAKSLQDAMDTQQSMGMMLKTIQTTRSELDKMPDMAMGPIGGYMAKFTKEGQVLTSSLNSLALLAKNLYKLGSGQGFTDQDRDFLVAIEGGVHNYKGAVSELLNKAESLAEHVNAANWIKENGVRKRGMSSDEYSSWISTNPAPQVRVKNKDGIIGTIPADQLKEALASKEYTQL